MLHTIKELIKENKKLKTDLKKVQTELDQKRSSEIGNYRPSTNENSYSNVLQNKKKENVVIIKKKDENDVCYDLFKEADANLNKIKNLVLINNIKRNKSNLILNAVNEDQQKKIIEELSKSNKLIVKRNSKLIPSILIKEVSKELGEDDIVREIAENEGVDEESLKIKKIISNLKFKTNRILVNFSEKDTIKIVNKGVVKIGYMCCPIEKIYNPIQCFKCFKYGHRCINKNGEEICRSKKICPKCANEHEENETCPAEDDTRKIKCSNRKRSHEARSRLCSKRTEVIDKLKTRFIC
jgi:cell division septum initiation protein DivIVA